MLTAELADVLGTTRPSRELDEVVKSQPRSINMERR